MANATHGYGAQLKIGDGATPEVFTAAGGLLEIGGIPDSTLETIDVTAHDSADAHKEYIGGLIDAGEVSATLIYVKGDTQQDLLVTNHRARSRNNYKIVLADSGATTLSFSALVTKLGVPSPIGDKLTRTVSLKITGKPVLS